MRIGYRTLLIVVLTLCSMNTKSQETVRLWDDATVSVKGEPSPELFVYKASENLDGKAIVICPGGGYAGLAMDHEGHDVAKWLSEKGITAAVLKYRMPKGQKDIPLEDAQAAMRYMRDNAVALDIDKNKVGILGFSAGGHLAATLSNQYATSGTNTRPDFSVLFYPVITMERATHGGSKRNLMGENPSVTDIHRFSNERQVTVNTPPTILLLSDDDKSVPSDNSVQYYEALKRNALPATMYIFPEGGHGWGFRSSFKYYNQMTTLLEMWLNDLSL